MLASIVVSAAFLLVDYHEVIFLYKIGGRIDLIQMAIVFVGTLLLGPGPFSYFFNQEFVFMMITTIL